MPYLRILLGSNEVTLLDLGVELSPAVALPHLIAGLTQLVAGVAEAPLAVEAHKARLAEEERAEAEAKPAPATFSVDLVKVDPQQRSQTILVLQSLLGTTVEGAANIFDHVASGGGYSFGPYVHAVRVLQIEDAFKDIGVELAVE